MKSICFSTRIYTLYTESERHDTNICSAIMTRYMTPFLEAITSDVNAGPDQQPLTTTMP